MEWKDKFPKAVQPAYSELLEHLSPCSRSLFLRFDEAMREQLDVRNKYHRYSSASGWTYGYGRSYGCELLTVTIQGDHFVVLGIAVTDESSLSAALAKAKALYDEGFEERFTAVRAARLKEQSERSKRRVCKETAELERLKQSVDPQRLNRFKWCRKVSRSDLSRLYQGEANGLVDEALLDDIGLTFYMRCKQAKEVRACLAKGQIVCHHCGTILQGGRVSPTGALLTKHADNDNPILCDCGYAYTYREYRRSCNAVNMPGGRATPIFEDFLRRWPLCTSAAEKMLLIDGIIHECHTTLMSGEKGRSVCVNLIEGTLKQISELILQLAYGDPREQG